jgi:hypothetical protein
MNSRVISHRGPWLTASTTLSFILKEATDPNSGEVIICKHISTEGGRKRKALVWGLNFGIAVARGSSLKTTLDAELIKAAVRLFNSRKAFNSLIFP